MRKISNGAAVSGSDFNNISGTLTFVPGATSMAVNVPILADKVVESDEQFNLIISNAVGAIIADSRGNPSIHNDDIAASTAPSAPSARNFETPKVRRFA